MRERRLGRSGELSFSGRQPSRGEREEFLIDMVLSFLPTKLLHSSHKVDSYKELFKITTENLFISRIL